MPKKINWGYEKIPKNNLTQKNWDKKIITSQNNLNSFFQKTPPFSGGWGGHSLFYDIYFFSEYESTGPQDSKSAKKTKSIIPIEDPLKIKHWRAHSRVTVLASMHMPIHLCTCLSICAHAFPFLNMPLSFASMLAHLHASAIICRHSIASMCLYTYSCTGRHAHIYLCWYTSFCMHHWLHLHFVAQLHIFNCDHRLVRIHLHLFQHAFTCLCMHAHNLRVFGFPHNRLNV